ncbi:type IV pilin N-terminal domain-containing protein [Halosegnis marinus]|uniref:Type IV pilin N-terminal domain-containing protein n=1 Tax=Halosegnis marinus TaxID=3034023 RepID=A0ABD5ZL96_9EURY|nr:type IV pilin N-terminal domain-containing protein [Halosegnis sp. DT85]
MDLKQLFSEEDAVSPVIGVILMVAITVILAAVIGTFVLGLGDQVQSSAPNANFQFQYEDTNLNGTATIETTVTHNGGQDVDSSAVEVQIGGETAYATQVASNEIQTTDGFTGTLSTGSTASFNATNAGSPAANAKVVDSAGTFTNGFTAISGGDTVRVIWTSPNGGSSNTIGSSTVPN